MPEYVESSEPEMPRPPMNPMFDTSKTAVDGEDETSIPLDDFCVVYADRAQVETMGAFRTILRGQGQERDLPSNYLRRLDAFMNEQH